MLVKYIQNDKIRGIAEWFLALGLAVICYFLLSRFVYGTAEISGPSMNPTLYHGERVFINKIIYVVSSPRKGDVVAFPYPANPEDHYVKRIIGVSGDLVELVDNEFYINGELLDDAFSKEALLSTGDVEFPLTVPEGRYFVLGDNRNNSRDSRTASVGCVEKANIFGKISFRFMPFDSIGFIE